MERKGLKECLWDGRVVLAQVISVEWFCVHWKKILVSSIVSILCACCVLPAVKRWNASIGKDTVGAERAFHQWIAGSSTNRKLWKQLEGALQSSPELEAQFGTSVAQRLLALGEAKKGEKYALSAMKRASDLFPPHYSQFAHTTLLISNGKYACALQEAEVLKQSLLQDEAFWEGRGSIMRPGRILYAYNLLRIAALQQQIGLQEAELSTWKEFIQNAGWGENASVPPKTYDPESYALLAENFKAEALSLLDYISHRQAVLAR